MSLLDGLQHTTYQRQLKKRVAERSTELKPVNYEQAQQIGILFDLTDLGNAKEVILRYKSKLQGDRKRVQLLAYTDEPQVPDGLGFDAFCKKDLAWTSVPKGELIESFVQTPFDLLISLHIHACPPLEYLSAASKAGFRIGYYQEGKTDCYDFMVQGNVPSIRVLLKQIDHYLDVINQ